MDSINSQHDNKKGHLVMKKCILLEEGYGCGLDGSMLGEGRAGGRGEGRERHNRRLTVSTAARNVFKMILECL
jgi:hypothetical protein